MLKRGKIIGCFIVVATGAFICFSDAQSYMENLTRGLIAVKTRDGYFLSWRLLGHEDYVTAFHVYRGDKKLNESPITDATCYEDKSGGSGDYAVSAVIDGNEQSPVKAELTLSDNALTVPLKNASGYTAGDASCGDLDGDGIYEIILKEEKSPQDNSHDGVTGEPKLTAYKLDGAMLWKIDLGVNIREGAHYTQFMVYDLDGDGIAEIACKTAPGTKDGTGAYLKSGPAANADHSKNYRNSSGRILDGPEYYTVFDGRTGGELVTVNYKPDRSGNWGDDYGNRGDRFLAGIAYLDGERPSVIPCRGYYTRTTLWALDWRDGGLTERWYFDTDKSDRGYAGQGNHSLTVGDVDEDGKDEIVYGASCIDDDGTGLWNAKMGHGDAAHLCDIDPDRPGLEYWRIHENESNIKGQWGVTLLDAATGELIWGASDGADVGRGVSADVTASHAGMECWGGTNGLRSCKNESAGQAPGSANFLCWWDGDLLRELLDGNRVSKYGGGTLLTASGCSSINGTKSTPVLSADLYGDWREEVIFSCGGSLKIFTTTIPTRHKLYTLMHDRQYRSAIAWQNVAYNQPPHPGYFIGDGMKLPPKKPDIKYYNDPIVGTVTTHKHPASFSPGSSLVPLCSNRHFSVPGFIHGGRTTVTVYSLSGKALRSKAVNKAQINLETDLSLPSGTYLVKVDRMQKW
ncbi:MAG: hypothetical protein JW913_17395 [Chitinispirillaceae bacterium]|nr:hypothetical protein [Chitinispirillaceae bacterium]